MPAIYAHDKFGKHVYKSLDKKDKKIIHSYLSQFRIGLQGPDFLFYYKPFQINRIAQLGSDIHHEPAADLLLPMMEVIRECGKNSPQYAYVLGLICHFVLDSECHSYVNSSIEEFGLGHIELETEFERFMMERDEILPRASKVWKLIPVDDTTADTIASLYPSIDSKTARSCLFQMRLIKKILVAPGNLHYRILDQLMRITGQYDAIQGHLMKPLPSKDLHIFNAVMFGKLMSSIAVASSSISSFKNSLENGTELPDFFQRNFE